MSCNVDVAAQLHAAGMRVTVQRLKIAATVHDSDGRRTADEILGAIQSESGYAAMSLATVYRTLNTFADLRLIAEFDPGRGNAAFEWIHPEHPHHHLICVDCGSEAELDRRLIDQVAKAIHQRTGFAPFLDHVSLRGRCRSCSEGNTAKRN